MEIGRYNTLEISGKTGRGLVLTDGEMKILLPKKEIPRDLEFPKDIETLPDPEEKKADRKAGAEENKNSFTPPAGKKGRIVVKTKTPESDAPAKADQKQRPSLKVFVYNSDRDTLRATTRKPYAVQGEFARMKVKEVNSFGAFLDWGIPKDLFVPYGAQGRRLKPGEMTWVFIAMDSRKSGVMGFSNLEPFLFTNFKDLKTGMKVKILIRDFNDNGARVIVDHRYPGLIYKQDFDGPLKQGEERDGWIRKIRKDGKLDIGLWEKNIDMADKFTSVLLEKLKEAGGTLPITDHTSPEEIREKLGMSKRMFKMAEGILYREKKIQIHPAGIFLEGVRTPKTLKVKARDLNDLVAPGYDPDAEPESGNDRRKSKDGRGRKDKRGESR